MDHRFFSVYAKEAIAPHHGKYFTFNVSQKKKATGILEIFGILFIDKTF